MRRIIWYNENRIMAFRDNTTIYRANNVARFIIFLASQKVIGDNNEREGVTNLKLQKVLYLAQAYYLAKLDKPLFKDQIKAWEYGPVVPSVYNTYKKYKNNPITAPKDESSISEKDKEVLKNIWDIFGDYSASKLVDITHAHKPWEEAYNSKDDNIPNKKIKKYYKPILSK